MRYRGPQAAFDWKTSTDLVPKARGSALTRVMSSEWPVRVLRSTDGPRSPDLYLGQQVRSPRPALSQEAPVVVSGHASADGRPANAGRQGSCGSRKSITRWTSRSSGTRVSRVRRNLRNSAAVTREACPMTLPVAMSKAMRKRGGPFAYVAQGAARPQGRMRQPLEGCAPGSALRVLDKHQRPRRADRALRCRRRRLLDPMTLKVSDAAAVSRIARCGLWSMARLQRSRAMEGRI